MIQTIASRHGITTGHVWRRSAYFAAICAAAAGASQAGELDPPEIGGRWVDPSSLNDNQTWMADAVETVCPHLAALPPAGTTGASGPAPRTAVEEQLLIRCNRVLNANENNSGGAGAAQSNGLLQLTGDELNAAKSTSLNFNAIARGSILGRLMMLHAASGGVPFASIAPPGYYDLMNSGGASGDADAPSGGRAGAYVQARVGSGSRDSNSSGAVAGLEPGYDLDTSGLTVGMDYRVTDSLVIGAALNYGKSDADYQQHAGSFDSDGYGLSLYGSWSASAFYIDALGSWGQLDHDSRRNIAYTVTANGTTAGGITVPTTDVVDTISIGSTESDSISAGMSTGYNFSSNAWTFTPTLAINYLKLDVNGFTEKTATNAALGDQGVNLKYSDQSGESFQLQAGFSTSVALSQSWGIVLPYARFTYINEMENNQDVFSLRYAADPCVTHVDLTCASFNIKSEKPDRSYFDWALGLQIAATHGLQAFIEYDGLLDLENVDYGEVTLGVRYEFQ